MRCSTCGGAGLVHLSRSRGQLFSTLQFSAPVGEADTSTKKAALQVQRLERRRLSSLRACISAHKVSQVCSEVERLACALRHYAAAKQQTWCAPGT